MMDEAEMDGRAIADLLPWYANGRLTGRERHRVTIALASDPALQRELALIREEQTASIDANEALGVPSLAARERFFAALDAAAPARKRWFDFAGWLAARVPGWQPRVVAWGAVAAAVVVLAQAGVISGLIAERPAAYKVASVNPAARAAAGPIVLVSFEPTAPVAAMTSLLGANDASIIAGPLAGNLYRLRIGDNPLAKAEVAAVTARLKARADLIRFAAPEGAPD